MTSTNIKRAARALMAQRPDLSYTQARALVVAAMADDAAPQEEPDAAAGSAGGPVRVAGPVRLADEYADDPVYVDAAEALRRWAVGLLPSKAAVDIIVSSSLFGPLLRGGYLDDGYPDVERLLADDDTGAHGVTLSKGQWVLAQVCASLLGRPREGVLIDLGDLWDLDGRNRDAVVSALARHLGPRPSRAPVADTDD